MEGTSFGLTIAFGAGLLSFLSPCVLPLIPSYVTFITGLSLEDVQKSRRAALVHSLLFILGFTLIFLALGATATALGQLLSYQRVWISRVGGVLIIVFGLYMLGVFNVALFSRERRVHIADKPVGYLGTLLVGITFGAGWTPCIGPILGSILTYTASSADLGRGLQLLGAYSVGLAVPFLLAAALVQQFLAVPARVTRQMVWVSRASGARRIVVGLLMVTNYFSILASYLQALAPEALLKRIWVPASCFPLPRLPARDAGSAWPDGEVAGSGKRPVPSHSRHRLRRRGKRRRGAALGGLGAPALEAGQQLARRDGLQQHLAAAGGPAALDGAHVVASRER